MPAAELGERQAPEDRQGGVAREKQVVRHAIGDQQRREPRVCQIIPCGGGSVQSAWQACRSANRISRPRNGLIDRPKMDAASRKMPRASIPSELAISRASAARGWARRYWLAEPVARWTPSPITPVGGGMRPISACEVNHAASPRMTAASRSSRPRRRLRGRQAVCFDDRLDEPVVPGSRSSGGSGGRVGGDGRFVRYGRLDRIDAPLRSAEVALSRGECRAGRAIAPRSVGSAGRRRRRRRLPAALAAGGDLDRLADS